MCPFLLDPVFKLSAIALAEVACAQLLKGYTIDMFGDISDEQYVSRVKSLAASKGIRVRIRGEVSKEALFKATCTAKAIRALSHFDCLCTLLWFVLMSLTWASAAFSGDDSAFDR